MKKIIFVLAAVALAGLTLVSCDKYEDGRPDRDVRSEFNKMYPDAKDVEWEADQGYWKVSFETGTPPDVTEHEAWYDEYGTWVRTETELSAKDLPQFVKDAISKETASAIFENADIEYVETPKENYYKVEIEVRGYKLHYTVTEKGEVSVW